VAGGAVEGVLSRASRLLIYFIFLGCFIMLNIFFALVFMFWVLYGGELGLFLCF